MSAEVDLLVVGAGPVGLATAILAAAAGLRARVLERRRAPLDKPCGEGIMPSGVRALAAMGVELDPQSSAPFVGIRYLDGPRVAMARFREGQGVGVRRTVLSAGLLDRARSVGARIETGVFVRDVDDLGREGAVRLRTDQGEVRARYAALACGLRGTLAARTGFTTRCGPRPRFGIRRHFRIAPWSNLVEVHWAVGAEAYVTPVAPDEVGVALLFSGESVRFERLLARFPSLAKRLAPALACSRVRGAGPFDLRVARRTRGRVALLGDAAGYLDPLTGEGLALGFSLARALVDVVAREAPLLEYERAWHRITRRHRALTRATLLLARSPRLRRRVIGAFARHPGLFERALALAESPRPPV